MKLLKHILFFLSLFLVQFCIGNSITNVSFRKYVVVSEINSSEKTFSAFLELDFKENHILAPSLYNNVSFLSVYYCDGYTELVESWKSLSNAKATLRSIDNITAIDAFRVANPHITDDAIQAAFDGLKASRQQPFVNALGSCADNTKLIGSLNKSKLASIDEIKDALNKMRDYKTGKPQAGNLGFLEDNIPGVKLDKSKMWESVSLADARKEIHVFDAIEATGSSGTWLRITDSEYRMLNDLAKKLGGVKGKSFPEITGTLKIVSDNPYCKSCQGVIQQFSDMYPNIEITLIDGIK